MTIEEPPSGLWDERCFAWGQTKQKPSTGIVGSTLSFSLLKLLANLVSGGFFAFGGSRGRSGGSLDEESEIKAHGIPKTIGQASLGVKIAVANCNYVLHN